MFENVLCEFFLPIFISRKPPLFGSIKFSKLFLITKYNSNNRSSRNFLHSIGSNLINDRLPVFKSITGNLSTDKNNKNYLENLIESSKDDLLDINIGRKNSQSTFSNTSYEEDKKGNNYE